MGFESNDLLCLAHGTEVWLQCLCAVPAILGDHCEVGDCAGLRQVAGRRFCTDDDKEAEGEDRKEGNGGETEDVGDEDGTEVDRDGEIATNRRVQGNSLWAWDVILPAERPPKAPLKSKVDRIWNVRKTRKSRATKKHHKALGRVSAK